MKHIYMPCVCNNTSYSYTLFTAYLINYAQRLYDVTRFGKTCLVHAFNFQLW